MATLLFSAIGTVLGGPIGGALGALAGQAVDSALIGSPTREGPRLQDLSITTASYGDALPRHFGQMRVAGTVIWATDLVEHSETSGGGKGKPSLKTYTYSSSFAVALASRPIVGVGRIWADGNLLRGADGMLKVGGGLRLYTGHGDQAVDPLLASAEGDDCPAFRGTAYVVFEDLQLADFGNRIPTLTFEVVADLFDGESGALSVATLLDGVIDDADAPVTLEGLRGLSCEGSIESVLAMLQPLYPMTCDAAGERLTLGRERGQGAPIALGEATASDAGDSFGPHSGYQWRRAAVAENPPRVLRYYDVDRDYQPGVQRAGGRPLPGQPRPLDLPGALAADDARTLIGKAARSSGWSRESLAWRTAELDPDVAPGVIVTPPGQPGTWRVLDWEWRTGGIELTLERAGPALPADGVTASAGRANLAADDAVTGTLLAAFELPWDGIGDGETARVFAAASSQGRGWAGAELFADHGDGALVSLGSSGRQRAVIGTVSAALAPAHPLRIDRTSTIEVALASATFALVGADMRQLALGANRALVGEEIVQFGTAMHLGGGTWRLGNLLRGRGGTEGAVFGHGAAERFVLLDDAMVALDAGLVGADAGTRIAAVGLADPAAVESPIACRGITLKPLSPVHATADTALDGSLELAWTRRARGAWTWQDGVDVPLREEVESYDVTYGGAGAPVATWSVAVPRIVIAAGDLARLRSTLAGGTFLVRQRGTHAVSEPLALAQLT
jgi:hypothetical protein